MKRLALGSFYAIREYRLRHGMNSGICYWIMLLGMRSKASAYTNIHSKASASTDMRSTDMRSTDMRSWASAWY